MNELKSRIESIEKLLFKLNNQLLFALYSTFSFSLSLSYIAYVFSFRICWWRLKVYCCPMWLIRIHFYWLNYKYVQMFSLLFNSVLGFVFLWSSFCIFVHLILFKQFFLVFLFLLQFIIVLKMHMHWHDIVQVLKTRTNRFPSICICARRKW